MFFADPTAAFINIRRCLRPNGRLAFVCWRALQENLLDILPLRAASAHLPPQPLPDPDAPDPFAFANPEVVRGILQRAGFREIEINARDEQVGSGISMRCWRSVRGSELWARFFGKIPCSGRPRYRQCDPPRGTRWT
jgi:hypothetical protein